eukprot:Sspe_Gene.35046::Locus_17002_Transcript_1_5_Confidence_0.286_Length_1827::g.35046::m.35046/K19307/BMT5; 25S rRNA (uracil2634-N3)-methyltransferase
MEDDDYIPAPTVPLVHSVAELDFEYVAVECPTERILVCQAFLANNECVKGMECPGRHITHEEYDALRTLAVDNHPIQYNSSQTILVFGDGDFSWTRSLVGRLGGSAPNLVATTYDSFDVVSRKFGSAFDNIRWLSTSGQVHVCLGVDATHPQLGDELKRILPPQFAKGFDRVIFNFPHTDVDNLGKNCDGQGKDEATNSNRAMLGYVFVRAPRLLKPDGELHITTMQKPPYTDWGIDGLATVHPAWSLPLMTRFDYSAWPGYHHRQTNRDRSAALQKAATKMWSLRATERTVQVEEDAARRLRKLVPTAQTSWPYLRVHLFNQQGSSSPPPLPITPRPPAASVDSLPPYSPAKPAAPDSARQSPPPTSSLAPAPLVRKAARPPPTPPPQPVSLPRKVSRASTFSHTSLMNTTLKKAPSSTSTNGNGAAQPQRRARESSPDVIIISESPPDKKRKRDNAKPSTKPSAAKPVATKPVARAVRAPMRRARAHQQDDKGNTKEDAIELE